MLDLLVRGHVGNHQLGLISGLKNLPTTHNQFQTVAIRQHQNLTDMFRGGCVSINRLGFVRALRGLIYVLAINRVRCSS
jgi:hypothetical protein